MANPAIIRRFIPILLVSVLAIGMLLVMRPVPVLKAKPVRIAVASPEALSIPWPAYGQAALGAEGYGVLESHGPQTSVPMASITKLVTALTVLNIKPLEGGETGPTLVLGEKDVAYYPDYLSRGGSVVPVAVGQRISQYDALRAMLIPSANNMADSVAVWAYGSIDNYLKEANLYLKSLGLAGTSVADASGFSNKSVSTARDLVKLGLLAMKNPVIVDIVSTKEADLPLAGVVYNTNRLLGQAEIVGIKTGNTDEAGGCLLFAAKYSVGGQEILIIGAELGAPSLLQAQADSLRMLESAKAGFVMNKPISKDQLVGEYTSPWGGKAQVVAKKDLEIVTWRSQTPKVKVELTELAGAHPAGAKAGLIEVSANGNTVNTAAILKDELLPPPPSWRLFH